MHELEKGHHHLLLHTNRQPSVRRLALNERPEVMHKPVKGPPSHSQYVVKHVGGVDVEEILFEPTC